MGPVGGQPNDKVCFILLKTMRQRRSMSIGNVALSVYLKRVLYIGPFKRY